jgi:hypothetical protein
MAPFALVWLALLAHDFHLGHVGRIRRGLTTTMMYFNIDAKDLQERREWEFYRRRICHS